ncbi:sensor histidine kinase [soil metagenome]
MSRAPSLTVRLLLALIAPLIVSAVLIGAGGAWMTRSVVDYTSDRLLAGSVRAIAESVTLENGRVWVGLPPWSLGLLDSPQRDSVYYNVRQSGRILTGYADLPVFDAEAIDASGPVFRTIAYQGRLVRQSAEAITVPGASGVIVISVAQTLDSRQAIRKTLLTSVGLIEAGLVGLVAVLIWPAAMWGLRPLEGLRRRLAARSTSRELDFTPVALGDVPIELQSVGLAFNTLLGQLERSVQGVQRFTADASHQIRTPLAILKTHLTVLGRTQRSSAERQSITDSLEAVDRLQRLIEQLLGLARADALDSQSPDLGDLALSAQSAVQRWILRIDAASKRLVVDAPPHGVSVALATPLLDQIFDNLIDNALRYGGEVISLTVGVEADHAVLEFRDNGDGLPPDILARPFERFTRGSTSSGVGSGLGLSIVHALAARVGGEVQVDNMASGGVCITVALPLRMTPA